MHIYNIDGIRCECPSGVSSAFLYPRTSHLTPDLVTPLDLKQKDCALFAERIFAEAKAPKSAPLQVAFAVMKARRFMHRQLLPQIRISGKEIALTNSYEAFAKRIAVLDAYQKQLSELPAEIAPYLRQCIDETTHFFSEAAELWKSHTDASSHLGFDSIDTITFHPTMRICVARRIRGVLPKALEQIGSGTFGSVCTTKLPSVVVKLPKGSSVRKGDCNFNEAVSTLIFGQYTGTNISYVAFENGMFSIYMPKLEGINVHTLAEQGTITKRQFRVILKKVLTALSELHKRHAIHADVKPDNIMDSGILFDLGSLRQHRSTRGTAVCQNFIHPGYKTLKARSYAMRQTDTWALGNVAFVVLFASYLVDHIQYLAEGIDGIPSTRDEYVRCATWMYDNQDVLKAYISNLSFGNVEEFKPLVLDLLEPDPTKALSAEKLLKKYETLLGEKRERAALYSVTE